MRVLVGGRDGPSSSTGFIRIRTVSLVACRRSCGKQGRQRLIGRVPTKAAWKKGKDPRSKAKTRGGREVSFDPLDPLCSPPTLAKGPTHRQDGSAPLGETFTPRLSPAALLSVSTRCADADKAGGGTSTRVRAHRSSVLIHQLLPSNLTPLHYTPSHSTSLYSLHHGRLHRYLHPLRRLGFRADLRPPGRGRQASFPARLLLRHRLSSLVSSQKVRL
jgi:hypothetical protein